MDGGFFGGPTFGHIFGAATLAVAVATAVLLPLAASRPSWWRVAFGVLAGLAYLVPTVGCTVHGCDRGAPFQPLVGAVSLAAALIFCRRKALGVPLAIILGTVWAAFSLDYTHAVHRDDLIGNPTPDLLPLGSRDTLRNNWYLVGARDFARGRNVVVREGYLDEALSAALWQPRDEAERDAFRTIARGYRVTQPTARWYTYHTKLWTVDQYRFAAWTPGGKLSDIAGRMEMRQRPGQSQNRRVAEEPLDSPARKTGD